MKTVFAVGSYHGRDTDCGKDPTVSARRGAGPMEGRPPERRSAGAQFGEGGVSMSSGWFEAEGGGAPPAVSNPGA